MNDPVPVTLNLPRALVVQLDLAADREARTRSGLARVLLADVLAVRSDRPAPLRATMEAA